MLKTINTRRGCLGSIAPPFSRRGFLQQASAGFGWLAWKALFAQNASAALAPNFTPRAKNIIFCFMDGGPSHVDTFDPKPMLNKHEGKAIGSEAVSKLSQSDSQRVWLGNLWTKRAVGERPVSLHRTGSGRTVCCAFHGW